MPHMLIFDYSLSLSLSISSCSLFVTIPCACVSIFYLQWGLPSLAASVVIGYMVSGAFNSVTLMLSDWEYISYRVMIRNGATEPVEDDEDSDEDSDEGSDDDDGNDAVVNKGWNLLQYMRGGNNNNNYKEKFGDDEKNVSFISVRKNQKKYANADADDADDDESTGTNNTEITSGFIKKSSSWWLTFGRNHKENELRRVVLGPGKLGYTIQSTKVNYICCTRRGLYLFLTYCSCFALSVCQLSLTIFHFCSFFFKLQRMDRWS
jgi:hypothetical protein